MNPRLSILSNVKPADLKLEPYPHVIVENALDSDVFEALASTFPDDDVVVAGRPVRDTWYDYPACSVVRDQRLNPMWTDFFRYHTSAAFFRELLTIAGPAIQAIHPQLESRAGKKLEDFLVGMRPGGKNDPLAPGADLSMECQFYVNYTQVPRTVRGPHVDRPSELFAALLYFRRPNDDSSGGNLEVCEPVRDIFTPRGVRIAELPAEVDASAVRLYRAAPYTPNTLALFINSPRAIHSVAQRSATPLTRRHINFCADVNFDLFDLVPPPRLRLKRTLDRMPVVWRLSRWI